MLSGSDGLEQDGYSGTLRHREVIKFHVVLRQTAPHFYFSCVRLSGRVTRHSSSANAASPSIGRRQKIMLPEEGRPVVVDQDAVSHRY